MSALSIVPIKSGKRPSGADYARAIQKAAEKTANLTKRDLEATVRTWKHKPVFDVTVEQHGDTYSITASTDDEIYGYVDSGTRPHIIRPRRSRYLRFRVGGAPKTRTGIIGSQSGSPGTDWRSPFFVLHPGGKARNFTKTIAKRRQITLAQETDQAIAKLTRRQAA